MSLLVPRWKCISIQTRECCLLQIVLSGPSPPESFPVCGLGTSAEGL